MKNVEIIKKLERERNLTDKEFARVIETLTATEREELFARARAVREREYGKVVYIRGYRLTPEDILECAREGYKLGFRTFVLQGGEDIRFTKDGLAEIIFSIKKEFPDCAVTLSVGERCREDYQCWYEAGADRYLLRHETADEEHYKKLHPASMSLAARKKCLYDLRDIGYQVGAGFMVGSPGQTVESLIKDLRFLQELKPHMIGIGPFLSHQETPFAEEKNGSFETTLVLLSILRLMFPGVLLPATTALGTIESDGREKGLLAAPMLLCLIFLLFM